MKTNLLKSLAFCTLFALAALSFSSCDSDDGPWWYNPPYGNTFNDSRLQGYWQLVQFNSENVAEQNANYMYFNGYGSGYYYYYEDGDRECDETRYWCQQGDASAKDEISIQYEHSQPLTSSYWFTHNNDTLWMQWTTSGGRIQTYVYDRIPSAPW